MSFTATKESNFFVRFSALTTVFIQGGVIDKPL
jgi:hypothetical protein